MLIDQNFCGEKYQSTAFFLLRVPVSLIKTGLHCGGRGEKREVEKGEGGGDGD
jgi:hypothetical protein